VLTKRLIVCLDVVGRDVTKGVKFKDNVALGNAVESAEKAYKDGVDELVFYDILASHEKRSIIIDVVREVASKIFIPFSVGGGLSTVEDMSRVIEAGAEKISVNSSAVADPELITRGAEQFGSQAIVLGMDVKNVEKSGKIPSGYEIYVKGGRHATGHDALAWAREGESRGAGEICLNSIDADGTKNGYEVNLTRLISTAVGIPVIASGGAGTPGHIVDVLTEGAADAALVASMVHYGTHSVAEIKAAMKKRGVATRAA